MKDQKDMSERLDYLNKQKQQQEKRGDFYSQQLQEIKELLKSNEKEIVYNEGWTKFHEVAIENHKKKIQETFSFDEKIDQEKKLQFHKEQIENHHNKNIEYHKKEINALKKEIQLFNEGILRCKEQINFLKEKIVENTIV